jgi:predicted O-methyltransferase YrrM
MNFNMDSHKGQMHPKERKYLYDIILRDKPITCVECGTWKGGGSTYYISSALLHNNKGKLLSWEIEDEFYEAAVTFYKEHVNEAEYVDLFHGDFIEGMKNADIENIELAFLDGVSNEELQLNCFKVIEERSTSGTNVFMHDWKTNKNNLVKKHIKNSNIWDTVNVISDTVTGMCHIKRK